MKKIFYTILFLIIANLTVAQDQVKRTNTTENLIGQWTIDLRPTSKAEAYYQTFVVESIDDNRFTGTFYGSPVKNALINKYWDKLYFAFSTSDQSNEYFHSGYIFDGKVYGISYCPNREFTAPWTGIKK
ncbi:MAG: hypothetical protein HKO92_09525 [Flavobacteriaceae bacterium]|nr:hypothetical protein [Flavobacteriaceae bacterium]